MNIIEQIKAEIDKRYAEYSEKMKTDDFTYYLGMADALDLFEQFIDTLESEKPKDLALTIEDLELIHTFLYAVKNNKHGAFTFTRLSDEQYQEVINRFNKSKEEE